MRNSFTDYSLLLATVAAAACLGMACANRELPEQKCDLTALDQPGDASREPLLVTCECEVSTELKILETSDPSNSAATAIQRGDTRFLGVMEYSVLTPGVNDQDVIREQGVRIIDGTSDVVRCYEHARLLKAASHHALVYNQRILESLAASIPARSK